MAEYVAAQHEDTGTVLLSSFIEPEGRSQWLINEPGGRSQWLINKDTGTVLLSSLTNEGKQWSN